MTDYRTFGHSGLAVSALALGAMTFGTGRWGVGREGARAIFDIYLDAGGNFIDTADTYASGCSESMIGDFITDARARERLVLATKSGFASGDHVNSGGNGAKHINAALEGSLTRLRTDHVDLYWLHVWDMCTPAEEVLMTMATLIRSGKIRYWGISNAPAWYVAKLVTLARAQGMPAPIGLQYEYSLVERGIEHEVLPAAADLGLGVQAWSPLGGGFLSGKYSRYDRSQIMGSDSPHVAVRHSCDEPEFRLTGANPFGDSKFTSRNWEILEVLKTVASEIDIPPAEAALAWLLSRPPVTSVLIGASRPEQIKSNLRALQTKLRRDQRSRLDQIGALEPSYPSSLFTPAIRRMVFGGHDVSPAR